MKNGLRFASLLIILGAFIKIFLNTHIAFAFIGQILASSLQPAILNSPAKIAATWFDEKSRVIVTSVCCISNTIGVMMGFIIHTFNIDENTVNPKIFKRDFRTYIIIEAGITFIAGLLFIIFIREKPEHPPSLSKKSENRNQSFLEGIKKLRDILKDIARKDKVAVFVSSHILTEMELMCDKVAVINKGKIVKIQEINEKSVSNEIKTETVISVKDLTAGEKLLQEKKYEVKVTDGKLVINISQEKVPEIIKLFSKNDIDIYNITQKERSLEDIFFDATENKGGQKNEDK